MSHTGHMSHRLIMMLLSGALNALQIDHGGGGGGGRRARRRAAAARVRSIGGEGGGVRWGSVKGGCMVLRGACDGVWGW